MPPFAPDQLDLTFQALADRTRRAILARLAEGEATVNELAEPFDILRSRGTSRCWKQPG
jgi:DNA-binding transcriptional ArsR family regulator